MRCAIYFVPPPDDPLQIAAAQWLRRDPYTGARVSWPVEGLVETDHAFLTAAPRRFGFHGTLKAPFRLAPDYEIGDLQSALERFCRRLPAVTVPEMRIAPIQNAFALVPVLPMLELNDLAADFVTAFDIYRSPITDLDLARGDIGRFNGQQFDNLRNWGHPNVFDQFRFHMTLTGPIDELERDHVALVLQRHFGDLATAPLHIGQVALFVEPEPNALFFVHSSHQFTTQRRRKIA